MTKSEIEAQIKQIKDMDRVDLLKRDKLISGSCLDRGIKNELLKAIKHRLEQTEVETDPIAVEGEGDKPC